MVLFRRRDVVKQSRVVKKSCDLAPMASQSVIGFVGLDQLSLQLASSLLRSGYAVQAFEVICVMLAFVLQLLWLLNSEGLERVFVVDIYVSKGMSEVLNGKIMIISSGQSDAITRARPILSAMSEKLYVFEGALGAGSKIKMVIELLEGIHFVSSVEAISLGAQAGIHPWMIYDIISNAAGNSWVFKNHVPQLLRDNQTKHLLNTFVQNLGIVLDMAKSCTFPLPLLAVACQQLIAGSSHGHGNDGDDTLIKAWEKVYGVNITNAVNAETYSPEELANQITTESKSVNRIGFIGLGAMGFGMATHLLRSNFCVYKPTLSQFANEGGLIGSSPAEVSKDVDVLVIMVTNEAQAESVLYGDLGAVSALPSGASVIISSTVSPAYVSQLERRLQNEPKDLKLVDAPVSGGVKRASMGTLTIIASGTDEALKHSGSVLSALSEKLYVIKGGCGAGSGVKMVNQLLAGVHIASAAEAMAFGARLGLNTRLLFDVITNSGGTMFENRVPHMVDNDYTPLSSLDIFVKDLGIVSRECSYRKVPLHIATVAYQLFLSGSAAGWGRLDDASVVKKMASSSRGLLTLFPDLNESTREITGAVASEPQPNTSGFAPLNFPMRSVEQKMAVQTDIEANQYTLKSCVETMTAVTNLSHRLQSRTNEVYETLTGVKVEGKLPVLKKEVVLKYLPQEWHLDPTDDICKLNQSNSKTLVVLDDDPTGTQTVHDIEVLTEWNIESLIEQFRKRPKCFFILTNSRALSSDKATVLVEDICRNLCTAAQSVEKTDFTIEPDAAVSVLGEMDAWIICPFFLQGGRYTIDDVHYVADSERLVPAGDTEFAKDAAFGYKSSNLREWVEEKTGGRTQASSVASISIQLLRKGGPNAVCEHLCSLQKGSTCIVNAASDRDMAVFAAGMIQAELKGKRFLCHTAASFVSARIGIIPKAPILPEDLGINKGRSGGLIVVGSYVPKTTKQVEELKSKCGHMLRTIEISVDKLAMKSIEEREEEINRTAEMANVFLKACKDTLIMTSRELITGKTPAESLEINFKVSSALVEIVRKITTSPRYILAKGGITSSDLATKALEAKRAKIVGQALAGVPLWQLGPESRHPGVPYIVFPGNVGDSNALAEVVKSWARPVRLSSTKELLLNAEKGGYAVGAFNVYNLEGVEAVVAAAEEERSPAILQIHPSALKQGGIPLVACCISAAEQASVPITVHFDHGDSKQELMQVLELGFDSVMVDGSHLPFKDNISYTKFISFLAHNKNMMVEAELGRLSGTEDELIVEDYKARLTDANLAQEFIDTTGIDALAVCIGNVHGKYPATGPNLRLDLLKDLYALCSKKGVCLVLHGASGLSRELIKECIEQGVRKFNVNTEVRKAYMDSISRPQKDLIHVMASAKEAMKGVVAEKMRLFGSSGKAC
ncbi:hypothetical protein HYC85_030410 [Camellia sinensis]|uniref:Ketose-bisphosphate aldolase class-II family protein n=1 Tax=Camellia sinensis TaxID=4442 RepID=A0A7J7G0V4_CAMSI|nr:hypothetical protein HYC85_030410 [Camellia sinensis]